MVEKVEYEGKTFALILRSHEQPNGVNFITSQDNPLQLGILKHLGGNKIKPHVHLNSSRTVSSVQEILHIEYGEVEAIFYNINGIELGSVRLYEGDTILLLFGGHAFSIIKDSKILEVKQGPYYTR